MILFDLIIHRRQTTISYNTRTSDFLVEHHPHFRLNQRKHINVSNINHVVPIDLLLLIDCLRIGGPLKKSDDLLYFLFCLCITLCTRFICSDINEYRLYTRERSSLYVIQEHIDPAGLSLDVFGSAGDHLCVREKIFNICDAMLNEAFA